MGRVRRDGSGGGRGRVRLDLARRPLPLSRGRLGRRAVGGVDVPRRTRRDHGAGGARPPRRLPELPQSRGARQEGGRGGRVERWTAQVRRRRRDGTGPSSTRSGSRTTIARRGSRSRSRSSVACSRASGSRSTAGSIMCEDAVLLPTPPASAAHGRFDGRARPCRDPAPRGDLEHLVRLVRQHGRGVPCEAARDRRGVRTRRPRPGVDPTERVRLHPSR